MASQTWRDDPKKFGIMLARYKFAAKMFEGIKGPVAEIGCADGFGARIVHQMVEGPLHLYDVEEAWLDSFTAANLQFWTHDITRAPLPHGPSSMRYRAIYMLDVYEHIEPVREHTALSNICRSLTADGVFLIGTPSLESQVYASAISKAGHVNCKTGEGLRRLLLAFFDNVFMFGMNDEVIHTGFLPMAHYLFALCTGRRDKLSWYDPSKDPEDVTGGNGHG
jgi:hypothetical protein